MILPEQRSAWAGETRMKEIIFIITELGRCFNRYCGLLTLIDLERGWIFNRTDTLRTYTWDQVIEEMGIQFVAS